MLTFFSRWDGFVHRQVKGKRTKFPEFALFAQDGRDQWRLKNYSVSSSAKSLSWDEPEKLKITRERLERINSEMLDGEMSVSVARAIAERLLKHSAPESVSDRLIRQTIASAVAEALRT